MRIRTKLTALFLISVIAGVTGTAFFILRSSSADKENYIVELNSIAAPTLATSLNAKLEQLRGEIQLLAPLLQSTKSRTEKPSGHLLEAISRRFHGVGKIELYSGTTRVALLSFADTDSAPTDSAPLVTTAEIKWISAVHTGFVLLSSHSNKLRIAGVLDKGHLCALTVGPEFLSDALDLSRGLDAAIVSANGHVLLSRNQIFPEQVQLPLEELAISRVVVREMLLPGGERVLASFSPISELDGAYTVVFAPAVHTSELLKPILRSSAGFLTLILMITVIFGVFVSREIARPIEELTEATSKVATGSWQVLLRSSPRNEVGKLVKAFSKMVRDLAAREQELQKANQELVRSESLAALGRFSAGVAHEVKNPLSSILGYAQLIRRKITPESDAQSAQYTDSILDETRRANKIISDLLMFARQKPPTLQTLPLAPVVDRAIDLLKPQCDSAKIELRGEKLSGPQAKIDPEQMFQVLLNLIQNSMQAMEGRELSDREITVRLKQEGQSALLEVADTGPGISKENQSKLFEPFFSTKEIGKGSGLGLSLCHGIVSQHGGKIEVVSQPGSGATFRISLPVV